MAKLITDRIAALREKQEKVAARISELQTKARGEERKRETRRKIVVGGAMLHAMEKDPQLASIVRKVLDRSVGRSIDRAAIADLLPPSPAPATPAAAQFSPAAESLAS